MEEYTGKIPDGLKYINQENFLLYDLEERKTIPYEAGVSPVTCSYLYAEGDASSMIVIASGKHQKDGSSAGGHDMIAMACLGKKIRFQTFFMLLDEWFTGNISVYAQGANLPYPNGGKEALTNRKLLLELLNDRENGSRRHNKASVSSIMLSAGQGGYGIDVNPDSNAYLSVFSRIFPLNDIQRNTANGLQVLFALYGILIQKVIPGPFYRYLLHDACRLDFEEETVRQLIGFACEDQFYRVYTEKWSDEQILAKYSSALEYEVPWFCDRIKEASKLVADYRNEQ